MGSLDKALLASLITVMMIASGMLITATSEAEQISERHLEDQFAISSLSPTRTDYPGVTITVPDDQADIQSAVAVASDGDIILVRSGTYQEEVFVDKEVWIRGDTLGSKPMIVPPVASIDPAAFTLTKANVTISGFNITDFYMGVSSDQAGHNLSGNDFFLNTMDANINVGALDLDSSFIANGFVFSDNLMTRNSGSDSVQFHVDLTFDNENESDCILGEFTFRNNVFRSSATSGDLLELELNVNYMRGGMLTIGDIRFTNNWIKGGGYAVDFDGLIDQITGVEVRIGRLTIVGNTILDLDDGCFYIDYFDMQNIQGSTKAIMGDVRVADNILVTDGSGHSVYFVDYSSWDNIKDDTIIRNGNLTIENNDIDSNGYGIYIYSEYLAGYTSDDVRIFNQNIYIRDNIVRNSNRGVYLYLEGAIQMYENSYAELGDIIVTGNTLNSSSYSFYIYAYEIGYQMYDSSRFVLGDLIVMNNHITAEMVSGNDRGARVYYEYIGYNMYDDSQMIMGSMQITSNNIRGYYGIYFDYIYGLGANLYGSADFSMGDINISSNVILSGDYGIYIDEIYEIGYEMYGDSSASIGTIGIWDNNIVSLGSGGIYINNIVELGTYMHDRASFEMEDIIVSENHIISDSEGIFLDGLGSFGYEMYNETSFIMGGIMVNDNTISTNSSGIYISSLSSFGYLLHDNSSFAMGNMEILRNEVHSESDGITLNTMEYFGYYMFNWSIFTMGSILINDNTARTNDQGIYVYQINELGSTMEQRASFNMGNFEFSGNDLVSENDALHLEYLYYLACNMYGSSNFSMGDIMFNENVIISNGSGLYAYEIGDFGYYMQDSSSAFFGGIHMDDNIIDSLGDGILFDEAYYFVENMYDDSYFEMGNITMNGNQVRSGGRGVGIMQLYRWFASMNDGSKAVIGWVQINNNDIDSGGIGVFADGFNYFGAYGQGQASALAMGIQINDNTIVADDNGIQLADGINFGYNMNGEADITMGRWIIHGNTVESAMHAVNIQQSDMGMGMVSGHPAMEGIQILNNDLDTGFGISVDLETSAMSSMANITVSSIFIDSNIFRRTAEGDTILINYGTDVSQVSMFIIGDTLISNNEQIGSNHSVIHVVHQEQEAENAVSELGRTTIMGNNITGGSVGLELESVGDVHVFVNNFIADLDDISVTSTLVSWVSPEPIWYRHGMKNFSSHLGNYWDRYSGLDNNNDGVGDLPYNTGAGLDNRPLMNGIWSILPPWEDVTPPIVIITSPVMDEAINMDDIEMMWFASDDLLGLEEQWVKLDDGSWIDVQIDLRAYIFTNITEGGHLLSIRIKDAAGNFNETNVSFLVDITPPSVMFVSPVNMSAFNSTDISLEWSAIDGLSGVDSYLLAIGSGTYMDQGNSTTFTINDFEEGAHLLHVKALDRAGNEGTATITVLIDLQRPTLQIIHPTDGMIVTSDKVNLTWTGDGGLSGMAEYQLSVDGGNFTSISTEGYHILSDLDAGIHTITLKGFDVAGNFNTTSLTFTVDTATPGAQIIYPPDGSHINRTSFDVLWIVNGLVHPTSVVELRSDGSNWNTVTGGRTAVLDLPEGQHVIDVRATDIKGNTGAATTHFTVDITEPIVVSVSHEGTNAKAIGPIVITFSEPISNSSVNVKLNEATVFRSLQGGVLTLEPSSIEPGTTYTIDLSLKDLAGNLLERSLTFTTGQKGTVSGRIVDKRAEPVGEARIVFDTGDETETGDDGTFSIQVAHGSRSAIVYDKDGNQIGSFTVQVTGGIESAVGDIEVQPKGDKDDGFPLWILLLILPLLILVIATVVVIFILVRKSEPEEDEDFDEEDWEDDEDDDEDLDEYDDDDDWDDEEF